MLINLLGPENVFLFCIKNSFVSKDVATKPVKIRPVFHYAEFSARSGIFLCFVSHWAELMRKDKENPPSGKQTLKADFQSVEFCARSRIPIVLFSL